MEGGGWIFAKTIWSAERRLRIGLERCDDHCWGGGGLGVSKGRQEGGWGEGGRSLIEEVIFLLECWAVQEFNWNSV